MLDFINNFKYLKYPKTNYFNEHNQSGEICCLNDLRKISSSSSGWHYGLAKTNMGKQYNNSLYSKDSWMSSIDAQYLLNGEYEKFN